MNNGHLYIKEGVDINGLHPRMIDALPTICSVFGAFESPAVCTSGTDGEHMVGSLHYEHKALDWRIWYIEESRVAHLVEILQKELGPQYDVVQESTHIHVEYDA